MSDRVPFLPHEYSCVEAVVLEARPSHQAGDHPTGLIAELQAQVLSWGKKVSSPRN